MKKFLKVFLITLGVLIVLVVVGIQVMIHDTKQHSPEHRFSVVVDDLKVEVYYNRPSVKGRTIFGELVPYGKVWRTGANEPTTITFSEEVSFGNIRVQPGTYSLWTIPGEETWQVILNSGEHSWGVEWGGAVPRDPALDAAMVEVPVKQLSEPVELLTISVPMHPPSLTIAWEYTEVSVPLSH